jgi:hypothetical protein
MGPASLRAAIAVSCDADVTPVIADGHEVPLHLGRTRRLFSAAQRSALFHRDQCCIKCGAPASWTQAHHIVHWSRGGPTNIDNGCLLCPSCHDSVHHGGWQVHLGGDGHPWLTPPRTVDPRQRPRPAYNRRTLTSDDLPATSRPAGLAA